MRRSRPRWPPRAPSSRRSRSRPRIWATRPAADDDDGRRGRRRGCGRRRRRLGFGGQKVQGSACPRTPVANALAPPSSSSGRKLCSPAGVNSPVRAFRAVGGTPVFIERGVGPHVFDVDGNRYLDFVGSWGPLILGHADPDVVAAIVHTAAGGTTFGAPDRARGRVRRAHPLDGSVHGEDALRVLGHRGDDVRPARGPRVHGTAPHHQGGRRLPRSRRRAAREGRLGGGDPRPARLERRHPRRRRRHDGGPLQRSRRHARRVRGATGRDRRDHHRARSPPTWAWCSPVRPTCPCCAASAISTARC